jgi:hypothetical protein
MRLPQRTKLYGWDYRKQQMLRMTGKEWHAYAKLTSFKTAYGSDSAWGNMCEVWLDGTDINHKKAPAPSARDI